MANKKQKKNQNSPTGVDARSHDANVLLPPVCPQWLCVPFLLMNPASVAITTTSFKHTFQAPWVGSVTASTVWRWLDIFLLLVSSALDGGGAWAQTKG